MTNRADQSQRDAIHETGAEGQDVEVHIEELVLHGFAPGDRFRISDAVQQEITRLIAEQGTQGITRRPLIIERLDAGKFKVAPGGSAESIGKQVAQAVHQQLSPIGGRSRSAVARSGETRK
jgi:hypothetical protein